MTLDGAYYSAPYRLIGDTLWVAGGIQSVRIYAEHYLVATHPRVPAGRRQTNPDHLPPDKVNGGVLTRSRCKEQAGLTGPATFEVVSRLLDERPIDRLCQDRVLLTFAAEYGPDRLERACARCVYFDDYSYLTVRNILKKCLDAVPLVVMDHPPSGSPIFARPAEELLGSLRGGVSWS